MDRESMVFYKSWLEAIKNLPREVQGDVLTAVIEYGLYGETTEPLKPITSAMLAIIKPQIDANNTKYMNGCKGAEYGKLGGRPRRSKNPNETPTKPLENPNITPEQPQSNPTETPTKPQRNPNQTPNDNVYDNDNISPPKPPIEGATVATAPDASEPAKPPVEKKDWKKDYGAYLALVNEALEAIKSDSELLKKQQAYYPGVNILLSLEKACNNFWSTEAGWKHKKKSRAKEVDMKITLINAIEKNRVFDNNGTKQNTAKRYDNGDFLR